VVNIKFHGTRGSFPVVPHQADIDFLQKQGDITPHYYGGDTTCLEVSSDKEHLVIDAGSGLKSYNWTAHEEYFIIISHVHWDHIMGFLFFVPMFIPGKKVNIISAHPQIEQSVKTLFNGINFPVGYEMLGAEINYQVLNPYQAYQLNGFEVTPFKLDHPGQSFGYLLEKDGKRITTAFDTEYIRMSTDKLGADAPYYENLDMLIFDSQYDLHEIANEKMNWGHASASLAIDVAFKRQAKKLALIHHDPFMSQEKLGEKREWVNQYYQSHKKQHPDASLEQVFFAKDGESLCV
jgi:phosphoribosyl 1,2-cyclic phosphodiesterase